MTVMLGRVLAALTAAALIIPAGAASAPPGYRQNGDVAVPLARITLHALAPIGVRRDARLARAASSQNEGHWMWVLTNTSRVDAQGAQVCQTLPASAMFEDASGPVTFTASGVCVEVGELVAGDTTHVSISAQIQAGHRRPLIVATASAQGVPSVQAVVR